MSEVIGAAAVVKAAEGVAETTQGLLLKMFGPWADDFGQDLVAGRQRRKRENAERILRQAVAKSGRDGRVGTANLRAAEAIFNEGSSCDDELMAEYFSGLLSGSQTPDGRDDRAVYWAKIVGSLSSVQIRLHFLLYQGWAELLAGRENLNLGEPSDRRRARAEIALGEVALQTCQVDEFGAVRDASPFVHAVTGLERADLITSASFESSPPTGDADSPEEGVFSAAPTVGGIELFGWAIGLAGLQPVEFLTLSLPECNLSDTRLISFSVPAFPSDS